jgi:hypothetical protein
VPWYPVALSMAAANSKYRLPGRVEVLLATAARYLNAERREDLVAILVNARVEIEEGVDYDNWDGGQTGHGLVLHVPDALSHAALKKNGDDEATLASLLNRLADVPGEHFSFVRVRLDLGSVSGNWRAETGALVAVPTLAVGSDTDLGRIWAHGSPRVFLSHRAIFKVEAKQLKDELARYGAASFVAHEDIQPTLAWQTEIERALASMDVLVAMLSEGFAASHWTNQEIGVALGRGIPVVSLRIKEDPVGFVGSSQAVNGRGKPPSSWAKDLSGTFSAYSSLGRRLLAGLVTRWENASSYSEAIEVLDRFEATSSMPADLIARAQAAYEANDQLHTSHVVNAKYPDLLARWALAEKKGGSRVF